MPLILEWCWWRHFCVYILKGSGSQGVEPEINRTEKRTRTGTLVGPEPEPQQLFSSTVKPSRKWIKK